MVIGDSSEVSWRWPVPSGFMAHRLSMPLRSEMNTIWLLSEASGAPVVNRQLIGSASAAPSVPIRPVARVTW